MLNILREIASELERFVVSSRIVFAVAGRNEQNFFFDFCSCNEMVPHSSR